MPSHALLGEYGNGGSNSLGRYEYIWLPTEDGDAIPIGLYKSAKFFAVHADHLGTPRQITDDTNKLVWQWPYSAFGDNSPTGGLAYTGIGSLVFTQDPGTLSWLKLTSPGLVYNLRHPGQYADAETGLFYNYFRTYDPKTGRYTQNDPIGLGGGLNRFGYVGGNALSYMDPLGFARKGGKTGEWWEFTDRNFQRWYHQCIKYPGDSDADRAELADAYKTWIEYGKPDGKDGCGGPPPPPAPAPAEPCGDTCKTTATVVVVGGTAYLVYRCLRMVPSLLPPLWPTIPANLAIP